LAIDLGSTWCKAGYFDTEGHLLASGRAFSRFGLGYGANAAEMERVWSALCTAVRAANQTLGGRPRPEAIALSCRGGSGVWLAADLRVLPVPSFELAAAEVQVTINELYEQPIWGDAGPFAYGYAPAAIGRSVWLRRHEPEIWAQAARSGSLHDWIVLRLTGVWVTDPASGAGGYPWPLGALDLAGLPAGAFPESQPQEQIAGWLINNAARDLDLPSGIPVVVGCHDGVAANIGTGVVHSGDACITLGSNLVVRAVTGERLPDCFGYPILQDRWAWVRGVHGIAAQIDAIVGVLDGGGDPVAPERHATLTAAAEALDTLPDELEMPTLPRGFDEERRQQAREALAAGFSPGQIYRATLESAANSIAELVNLARYDGADCRRYVVTGAAAANDLLLRLLGAVLDAPIEIGDNEAGLRGAAVLAALGVGLFPNIDQAISTMVTAGRIVGTSPDERAALNRSRRRSMTDTSAAPGDAARRRVM
jgi:sugar (pentulose or hexulose) kinase